MPKIHPIGGEEGRVEEADLLRGIAILMVAAVHVFGNYSDMTAVTWLTWSAAMLKGFARVAVPLFLLLSGFVLVRRYYGVFSPADFYRRRLRVLLGPYLAFSLLYMAAYGWLKGWPSPSQAARQLVMASASEHLWFFRLIFQTYLLYPVLAAGYGWFEKKRSEPVLLLLALFLQMAANWAGLAQKVPADPLWADARTFLLTAPEFIFYFVLGMWAGRNFPVLRSGLAPSRALRAVLLAGLALGLAYWSAVLAVLGGLRQSAALFEPAMFVSIIILFYYGVSGRSGTDAGHLFPLLSRLGYYAYGIYLIHLFVLGAAVRLLRQAQVTADALSFYPLVFVATVLFSYGAAWTLHRTPLSGVLLGMPPRALHKEETRVR